jgi:hypothetical protein
MSQVDLLNSYMSAAIAAQAVGNNATALNNALAAQGLIACLPKISRSAGLGGGEMSASWDSAGIDQFVKRLMQMQGSTAGMISVPVTIIEPATIGNGEEFANSSGGYVQ